MDRRSFLRKTALGGTAAAASTLAAPAYAASHGNVELTMVTSWPRGFAVLDDAASKLEEIVGAVSDGSLTINKKTPGELVGALEVFDAVSSGQADMYHSADYYYLGQHPGYAFFTAVPFGATAQELTNWYHHGGGQELHDELGEIFNLKSFLAGNSGSQSGGWFRKEINSAEDFQGLKYRMPGLGGQVLSKLGASVQNIPGGELYQALSSGALDGLEWVGPAADERAGFHEVAKIYYTAGFHEPGSGLAFGINLDVYNGLSDQHKAVLKYASMATTQWQLALTLSQNGAALARLQAQGVKTLQFPDDVWDAFGAASKEVMDENMDDELYARIRASFDASVASSSSWIEKSDGYYVNQRNRVLGG
ncbi:MAG: ABC transporter substrate-binding protein [Marinosulfonomonas sp.]|nr:MAG: ABC transporter substrate-binding protein [Marinosulfonomonas sp.]